LVRRAFDLAGRKIGTMLDGQWVDLEWIETGECALVRDARGPCALSWSGPDLVRCTRGETSWSATRDTEGRAVELRGPHGEAMTLSWTRRGKLEGWRTADGLARRYGWHPTGAWMGVQDEVETRAFERDDDGRLVAVPHDDVRIEWHPAGYAARIRGQGLDEARTGGPGTRSTLVTRDGRAVEVLERDALGRVIVRHSGGRPRIALRWSAVGPLESIAWSEPVSAPTIEGIARLDAPEEQTVTLRFEHGAAGGLVAAHDPRGETTFERQGAYVTRETRGDRWVRVGRDEAGFRMALRSSLGLEVQLRRDAGQRIAELSAVMEGETLEVAFAYDPHGREVRRAFGDGLAIELERDALGRVIARRVLRGGRMLDETTYTWRGARLHEEQSRKSVRYAHDEAGRLCWVVPAEGEARAVWSSAEGAYRGPLSPGCRYASCGQPLATPSATFRYDAAGRREARIGPEGITRYAYDAVSRLVRVEEPARTITHTYDALGRRLVTTVSAKPKSAPSDEERESDAPTPREGIVEHVWDGLELLHRVGDYAEPVTHVHADGVLVALRAEGAWWIVLPDMGGQPDALVGTNGEVRWSRAPMTSIGGVFDAHDEGIAKLGVPALAGHLWDPASGLWHALSGDFDPETARYLTPAPLGASAGPWLYAAPPDPLRPRSELLPRASVPPYDELGHDGFDALWLRHVVESVACERDEGARRAWVAMHDDRPPDVTAWMRGAWR
jgi:YD repeat-containing protein